MSGPLYDDETRRRLERQANAATVLVPRRARAKTVWPTWAVVAASVGTMLVLLGVGFVAVSFFFVHHASTMAGGFPASDAALTQAATHFPITCSAGQKVSIVGQTYSGDGTLITAADHCSVVISHSTLHGARVVGASNAVTIVVNESVIDGSESAIVAGDGSTVTASGTTTLSGKNAVVVGARNSVALIGNVTVKGGDTALVIGAHGHGNFNHVQMSATNVITGQDDEALSISESSTVTGSVDAVSVGDDSFVSVLRSSVSAGDTALALGKTGHVNLSQATVVGARAAATQKDSTFKVVSVGSTVDGPWMVNGKSVSLASVGIPPR